MGKEQKASVICLFLEQKHGKKKKTQGRYDGLYKNAYSYVVIN